MAEKQPLKASKSVGEVELRAIRGRRRNAHKTSSAHELQPGGLHVIIYEEEESITRRTQSAPLTLEAASVARELKRLSDSLQSYYQRPRDKRTEGRRRHTVGESSLAKEWKKSSIPSEVHDEESNVFRTENGPSKPEGTEL